MMISLDLLGFFRSGTVSSSRALESLLDKQPDTAGWAPSMPFLHGAHALRHLAAGQHIRGGTDCSGSVVHIACRRKA